MEYLESESKNCRQYQLNPSEFRERAICRRASASASTSGVGCGNSAPTRADVSTRHPRRAREAVDSTGVTDRFAQIQSSDIRSTGESPMKCKPALAQLIPAALGLLKGLIRQDPHCASVLQETASNGHRKKESSRSLGLPASSLPDGGDIGGGGEGGGE